MDHKAFDRPHTADQHLAVIGLGYVGLPLAVAFGSAGIHVIGIDLDERKLTQVNAGQSYIPDVPTEKLADLVAQGRLRATREYAALAEADSIFICVPTPFDAMRAPDLSFIIAAAEGIAPHLQAGQMVVLQSTTYPGTTQDVVQPILERSGLRAGRDFNLAFSPERIDPGNQTWTVVNTPKVVGGLTPACTTRAEALLSRLSASVVVVSSPRAAEMTKLLENIFRSVNIALVNELALLSERMDVDIWEVIRAASTKPFGYMPFYPSAGVGGHCIGVDPYYLSWKAREYDFYTRFIELAADVNQDMPFHVVDLLIEGLGRLGKAVRGARVLVLGVAFKRDIDDARNSPAERVIELLTTRGASVSYHDPYIPSFHVGGNVFQRAPVRLTSAPLAEALAQAEAVVIVTGHRVLDYGTLLATVPLVVDTCNATYGTALSGLLVRLGAPRAHD